MRRWPIVLMLACWLGLAGAARADVIDVTRHDDPAGNGNCPLDCSLRQAIEAAHDGDTVHLFGSSSASATYSLTRGTLLVNKPLTITGGGPAHTTIDGQDNQSQRIMKAQSSAVVISGVTFANAFQDSDEVTSSVPLAHNGGAALFNESASVTLDNVAFTGNYSAVSVGGAVSNRGTLTMTDVDFLANGAYYGAGVFAATGTVTATSVTFRDGTQGVSAGGAMYVLGATVSLTNATVVRNGASNSIGGGLVNQAGNLALQNVTLQDNFRGGVETGQGATTSARNTIFGMGYAVGSDGSCSHPGRNTGAGYVTGPAITNDLGHNLDEDGTCALNAPGDVSGFPAALAADADNGGATHTVALLYGSSAIDGGSGCAPTDQRGVTRPQGSGCDMGALEAKRFGSPDVTTDTATDVSSTAASLRLELDLKGEAGAFMVAYGTSPQDLALGATFGAGVIAGTEQRVARLVSLTPNTTYYYQAIAKNASGTAIGETLLFTTGLPAPEVFGGELFGTTDTSVSVAFSVNPNGQPTTYKVKWTYPGGSGESAPVDVGSGDAPISLTHTISGLTPGVTYDVDIEATNSGGTSTLSDGPLPATLLDRITGEPGTPTELTDAGTAFSCPDSALIDWGDGTEPEEVTTIGCIDTINGWDYTLNAAHVYRAAGRFPVRISYPSDARTDLIAQIATARRTLTVDRDGAGAVTGTGIDCGSTCTATYDRGTTVTLTATPAEGNTFAGWNGACTGTASCTVTLDADTAVSARFTPIVAQPAQTPAPTAVPTPAPTPPPAAPPEPEFHKTVVVTPEPGTVVLIKVKGTKRFVALKAGQEVPLGSQIDVTKGKITLTSVSKPGAAPESAQFYGGIFTVTQVGAITNLALSGPEPTCKQARASAGKKVKKRSLWGDGKGKFRTEGKYSAATVRGTTWYVEDNCSGTLTKVKRGLVAVTPTKRRGKVVVLRAGKRYLVRR